MQFRSISLLVFLQLLATPLALGAQNGIGHVNGCRTYTAGKVGFGNNDQFGRSTTHLRDPFTGLAGDIDGDGIDDILVGAQGDKGGTSDVGHGAAYLLLLDAEGDIKRVGGVWQKFRISEDTLGTVPSNHPSGFGVDLDGNYFTSGGQLVLGDHFGKAAVGVGDLDGNGVPDVAVAAPYDDLPGKPNAGAIYFLFLQNPTMNGGQPVKSIYKMGAAELAAATPSLAIDAQEEFGRALVFLGDFQSEGGGRFTLVVGATGDCDGCPTSLKQVGALYVMQLQHNSMTGSIDYIHSNKIDRSQGIIGGGGISPTPNNLRLGTSCTYIGEDSGYHYFASGSNWNVGGLPIPGGVFMLQTQVITPQGGGTWELQVASFDTYKGFTNAQGQTVQCTPPGNPFCAELDISDVFGYSVCGIGDWDLNGFPDLAIGLLADEDPCNSNAVNVGGLYIVLLSPSQVAGQAVDVVGHQKISLCEGSLTSECSGLPGQLHAESRWASSMTWLECHDGSGSGALVVGARWGGGLGSNKGTATLLYLERNHPVPPAVSYNGTHEKNPNWLFEVEPALAGKNFVARVVPDSGATVTSSVVAYHLMPDDVCVQAPNSIYFGQEVLVQGQAVFSTFAVAGGDHVVPMPLSLDTLGAKVFAQGVALDGTGAQQLTNRLEVEGGDFLDPDN